jgi:two-component system, OmpR family, response regulator ChvI
MDEQALSREIKCEPAARIVTLSKMRELHDDLLRAFALGGAVVEEVAEFPALLARMNQEPRPDLVVLGWETASGGIETLQRFAESWSKGAALFLAASQAPAEDRMPAPPSPTESAGTRRTLLQLLRSMEMLVAEANARPDNAAGGSEASALMTDGLDLRFDTSRALWKEKRVDLSLTEFRVVSRLARSGGRDVSHRELYDIIKGEGFVSGTGSDGYRCNVRAAIKRIRQKFRLVDPEFTAIRSYHGFGYRWDEAAGAGDEKESVTTNSPIAT